VQSRATHYCEGNAMQELRRTTPLDHALSVLQAALGVVVGTPVSQRPHPSAPGGSAASPLSAPEKAEAAALMRVNHVGEICAQALYEAQALFTRNEALRAVFRQASVEESDHLAWTAQRVGQLGGRLSLLVPVWYGGAFAVGALASLAGDAYSLGFMSETERQVEAHLLTHLDRLPPGDHESRAIVAQMKADEAQHGLTAREHGGVELPFAVRWAMQMAARVMTTTAHYI
jgi:ubiquinone biosynthesis monooxygenase Coq7